jgi:hypothetical protein
MPSTGLNLFSSLRAQGSAPALQFAIGIILQPPLGEASKPQKRRQIYDFIVISKLKPARIGNGGDQMGASMSPHRRGSW